MPVLEALVAHPRVRRAREAPSAELAHLVLCEVEEVVVAKILHGAVLDEHVQLGTRGVLDGEDARHVGELDVGLGLSSCFRNMRNAH